MNPNEPTSKDVLEAGFKALFGPVQDLFLKLTGPAAEECGLMWQDSVRIRRTIRIVRGLVKVKGMVEEAGFSPGVIPDKLLLPIFEGMSVEEDEDLHTMWAALLANAADSRRPDNVHPLFSEILRQLTPVEARLLRDLYDHGRGGVMITLQMPPPLSTSNLVRHGLVNSVTYRAGGFMPEECVVTEAPLGITFVTACSAPKK